MYSANAKRIMMISTHGYVSGEPRLGRRDTGGQVAYVLDLSRCLGELGFEVDVFTRRFEDQPPVEHLNDRVRVIKCAGVSPGPPWASDYRRQSTVPSSPRRIACTA